MADDRKRAIALKAAERRHCDAEREARGPRLPHRDSPDEAEHLGRVRNTLEHVRPEGSVAGGVKPGTSSGAGTGWHKW